jgi:acetyl-CoA acetyltransferase
MVTENAPDSFYRTKLGLGVWEHRGKVAATGVGHSPTSRRWDGKAETSVGAFAIDSIRKAIADSGIAPSEIDGLVLDATTTTGAHWEDGAPIPMDVVNSWNATDDPLDGIAKLSAEWIIKNMPELTNVKFTMYGPGCMSRALVVAAQAVGDGLTNNCIVLKGWHNLEGRYYQGGANALDTRPGTAALSTLWGTPASYGTALQFAAYCTKYGKSHDQMAPFVVQERANGLNFPEGFWAQHRPEPLTIEDYLAARWIAKPANLYDNDIPIMATAAYIFTTAERVGEHKQKPVYILNHASSRTNAKSLTPSLQEVEDDTYFTGQKIYEGAGIGPDDLSFENMYDGFTLFHQFHLEGLRYRGVQNGEALDFYGTDISNTGPNPTSPSGGNAGSGRTRFWMHTDCIQQIQGRAGDRAITGVKPEIGVSGGPMPMGGDYIVWSATPN